MICRKIEIINRLGLHARAAARLVAVASASSSSVQLSHNGRTVNAKSIMGVMMLAAARGSVVELRVDGDDERAAADRIAALVADRFGEEE